MVTPRNNVFLSITLLDSEDINSSTNTIMRTMKGLRFISLFVVIKNLCFTLVCRRFRFFFSICMIKRHGFKDDVWAAINIIATIVIKL